MGWPVRVCCCCRGLLVLHLVAGDDFEHRYAVGPVAAHLRQIQHLLAAERGVVQSLDAQARPQAPIAGHHEARVPRQRGAAGYRGIIVAHAENVQIARLQQARAGHLHRGVLVETGRRGRRDGAEYLGKPAIAPMSGGGRGAAQLESARESAMNCQRSPNGRLADSTTVLLVAVRSSASCLSCEGVGGGRGQALERIEIRRRSGR